MPLKQFDMRQCPSCVAMNLIENIIVYIAHFNTLFAGLHGRCKNISHKVFVDTSSAVQMTFPEGFVWRKVGEQEFPAEWTDARMVWDASIAHLP